MDIEKPGEGDQHLPPSYNDIYEPPPPTTQQSGQNDPYNPYTGYSQPIGLDRVGINRAQLQQQQERPLDLVTPNASVLLGSEASYGSHSASPSPMSKGPMNPYEDEYPDETPDKGDSGDIQKEKEVVQFQNTQSIQNTLKDQKLQTSLNESANTVFEPSQLQLFDFWYPSAMVEERDLRNPCGYLTLVFFLPISFFAWLWFQIATISRLSPGGTPHSANVPQFLLRNIYNEQAEINHILGLSEVMATHADTFFVKNQHEAIAAQKGSKSKSIIAPITTSTTASIASTGSSRTDRNQRRSGCCDCGKKREQIQEQRATTTAVLASVQSVAESTHSKFLNHFQQTADYEPELYRAQNSNQSNNSSLVAAPEIKNFPSLSLSIAWLMDNLTVDRIRREYRAKNSSLFRDSRNVVVDYQPTIVHCPGLEPEPVLPVRGRDDIVWNIDSATGRSMALDLSSTTPPYQNTIADQNTTIRQDGPVLHSLSPSLPFRHKNGQIMPSHNLHPTDVMKLWQEDELRYSFWLWDVMVLTIGLLLLLTLARLEHAHTLKIVFYATLFSTAIFVSQFVSRCRHVKKAFKLTLDQAIAFPIGFYINLTLISWLQAILQASVWFVFVFVTIQTYRWVQKLKVKPLRQLEYEHHIMVVTNYLHEQVRRKPQQPEEILQISSNQDQKKKSH